MRLLKAKNITVLTFSKTKDVNGRQDYTQTATSQMQVSIHPMKPSMASDYQIDLARIRDFLVLYSNEILPSDQSTVVQINGRYYTVYSSEDNKFLDARTGYYKTIVKLNVDPAYGLS